MAVGAFLWGMRIIVLAGFLGVAGIVSSFIPYFNLELLEANYFTIGLFYFFLFLFLLGVFSLFLFKLKGKGETTDRMKTNAGVSFRQGFFISIMVLGLLLLQSFRILVWWDALLVIGAVLMLELYCLIR